MQRVLRDEEELRYIFDGGALDCEVCCEVALLFVGVEAAVGGLCGGGGRGELGCVCSGGEDLQQGGLRDDDVVAVGGGEGEAQGVGDGRRGGELSVDFGHCGGCGVCRGSVGLCAHSVKGGSYFGGLGGVGVDVGDGGWRLE